MSTILQRRLDGVQLRLGKKLLAIPVLVYALLVFPFVFHDVVGEPDLERTVMAVLYGATSGLHEAAGYHYGLEVSFGYYAALYHLLPHAVLVHSSSLIEAINLIGYVSAVLAMGALALYVTRLFGVTPALITCILFGFSPVFLDLGTSGHPQVPGLAFTLIGAWLLTYVTDTGLQAPRRIAAAVTAWLALTVALTFRGDFVLAFPFITLVASDRELTSRREWLRAAGTRIALLIAAFAVFLILQSVAFSAGAAGQAGFVSTFFATFYKPGTIPRGLMVVVLCTGVASTLAFLWLIVLRAARSLPIIHPVVPTRDSLASRSVSILALGLPSLAFWLPNSTPGRHLILVTLGVALTIALILTHDARPRWALPAAVLLVISNQAIAEVSHSLLGQHYQWTFPLVTGRRATQSVPMGTLPLDHDAKQELFMRLRNEGRAFARTCSGNVLAFAEQPHYMMLSLFEADPAARMKTAEVGGTRVFQFRGTRCSVDFVEKAAAWHRDALREFLEAGYDAQWPIYFQESRRNPSDRTSVPEERRYCIEKSADGECVFPSYPG